MAMKKPADIVPAGFLFFLFTAPATSYFLLRISYFLL